MARPKLGEGDTQRLQLKISAEELEAINDWRFANRVASRSEAVRRLCQIALNLEPLVIDLKRLWRDVQLADSDIGGRLLDAFANINTIPVEDNLSAIDRAFDKLVPAALELGIHADAMAQVYEALQSGNSIEESIESLKDRARSTESTRDFVRKNWGRKS